MDNREAALALAALGLAVFPCKGSFGSDDDDAKRPMPGMYWRKLSTTDARQVERWWSQWPGAIPAIDLAKSSLYVVDCDMPKRDDDADGVSWFRDLAQHNAFNIEALPRTVTLRGGWHVFFRQPSERNPLGNGRGSLPTKNECGVDGRGAGGFVIGPGASLPDGRRYAAVGSIASAPQMPGWLEDILRGSPPNRLDASPSSQAQKPPVSAPVLSSSDVRIAAYAEAGVEEELRRLRTMPEGQRNATLNLAAFSIGQMVGAGWVAEADAQGWLEAAAHDCGLVKDDGIRSVRATIRSGLGKGRQKPRELPPEVGPAINGAAVARQLIEHADGTVSDAETGEVIEFDPKPDLSESPFGEDWTEFRIEGGPARTVGLIGDLIDWICATSLRPNRPLAMAAAISIVGTVASRHMVGPTHSSPHLFIACLGETSIGKARPMKAVSQVLGRSGLGSLIKTGKFKSDSSVENMIEDCPVAVAIVDEIGSNLFAKMTNKRASSHESTISAVLRELWSIAPGDIFSTSARAGWPSKILESPILSIFGVSTIQEFYRSLSGGAVENGFLNRFTIIRAAPRADEREPTVDPHIVPDRIIDRLRAILPPDTEGNLPGLQAVIGLHAPGIVTKVPFADDEAKGLYQAFSKRMLRWSDDNTALEPFVGRTAEMAIRLATVHAIGDAGREARIGVDDFRWGASIALDSAGFMIADAAANMAENDYQVKFKMVQEIIRRDKKISREGLYRRIDGRIELRQLDSILSALETANQITIVKEKPGATGGRPKIVYVHGGIKS